MLLIEDKINKYIKLKNWLNNNSQMQLVEIKLIDIKFRKLVKLKPLKINSLDKPSIVKNRKLIKVKLLSTTSQDITI